MKKILFSLLLVLPGLSLTAQNQFTDVKTKTLANGLVVIVKEVHEAPIADIQLTYRVGLRDSPDHRVEMPHFVEHMLFKGTPKFPRDEFSRLITENGGYVNGYTFWDRTTYVEEVPSFQVKQILEVEASRMTEVEFPDQDVKDEAKVVQSEIRNQAGNQTNSFYRELNAKLNLKSEAVYDYDTRLADIGKITPAEAKAFYQQYYRPDNAFLVVTGDVSAAEVFTWADQTLGQVAKPAQPLVRPLMTYPPIKTNLTVSGSGVVKEPFGFRYFNFLPYAPKSRDFVVLFFLNASGLIPELSWNSYPEGGYLVQNFNTLAPTPLEVIDWSIMAQRFADAKSKTLARRQLGWEEVSVLANILTESYFEKQDPAYEDWLTAQFASLDFSEIKTFAEKYFAPGPNLVAEFKVVSASAQAGPQNATSLSDNYTGIHDVSFLDDPQSPKASYYKDKAATAYQRLEPKLKTLLANVKDYTLDNGLRLIVRQGELSRKTWVNFLVPAGQLKEKIPFTARQAAYLVFEGGPQIIDHRALEKLGVQFYNSGVGDDYASYGATGPGDKLAGILQVLAKGLGPRSFDPQVVAADLEENLNALQKPTKDMNYWLNENVKDLFQQTGSAPYNPDNTTAEDRARLTAAELKAFYEANYRPQGAVLVITSPEPPDAVLELVKASLGHWQTPVGPAGVARDRGFPGKVQKELQKFSLVDRARENIVLFFQAVAASGYSQEREIQLDLGSNILSDAFTGRLFRNLRIKQALTYGVSVWDNSFINRSLLFRGFLQASPENLDKAIAGFKSELVNFQTQGPTPVEFYFAQNKLINGRAFQFRNTAAIHDQLVQMAAMNLPLTGRLDQMAMIAQATPEVLQKVWQADIDPQALLIAIAGPGRK